MRDHGGSQFSHTSCGGVDPEQTLMRGGAAPPGHVIGLGDRHSSNILVHKRTANVVHIDLGVAFEQGRFLNTPEMVPFRLTRDMVDGMGISGALLTARSSDAVRRGLCMSTLPSRTESFACACCCLLHSRSRCLRCCATPTTRDRVSISTAPVQAWRALCGAAASRRCASCARTRSPCSPSSRCHTQRAVASSLTARFCSCTHICGIANAKDEYPVSTCSSASQRCTQRKTC